MEKRYQVMPELTPEEYEDLKKDIQERGVMVPIEFDEDGNILDGFNRKQICDELGITDYPTVVRAGMTEEEKFTHARKLNLARRHLSQEQMRGLIEKQIKETPEKSDRLIAEEFGVSGHTVAGVRNEMKAGHNDMQCPTEQSAQLDRTLGADGKKRPVNAAEADQQRSAIQKDIIEHPEKTDRQIAKELGASPTTVGAQRKKIVSVYNPSDREAEALKDPDIVRRVEETGSDVARAIRQQKRDKLVEHLESDEVKKAKAAAGVYDVVIVDPPWPSREIQDDTRADSVGREYPIMSIDEIKAIKIPAAKDCHVFLWTPQEFLPVAFDVLQAWGAKYVCTFVWSKGEVGPRIFGPFRINYELCLYAHIGAPVFIDQKAFKCGFHAPETENGQKPIEFYDTIRRVTAGRRLEIFGRRSVKGFDKRGKESF